ncbi:hypothetical protein [Tissierella sp.]|uniref:hypothetical protein n=1 Tax=Tissierella sp. TaxID=41274 RepID=UPI00302DCE15
MLKDIDLDNLKKSELKRIAKSAARINDLAWNFICEIEDFVMSPIFKKFLSNDDNKEFLTQFALVYKTVKKTYEDFAELELNSSYFQDMDYFFSELYDYTIE